MNDERETIDDYCSIENDYEFKSNSLRGEHKMNIFIINYYTVCSFCVSWIIIKKKKKEERTKRTFLSILFTR